jgi:hypothetical protein
MEATSLSSSSNCKYEGKYRLQEDGTLYVLWPVVDDPDAFCEELAQLKGVCRASIEMHGTRVIDRGVRALATMTSSLVSLGLDETLVTDDGVAALAGNVTLKELSLEECRISNASLPVIGTLMNLEQLNLARCTRLSQGGEHLAKLNSLHWPLCVPDSLQLPFDQDKLPHIPQPPMEHPDKCPWWYYVAIEAKIHKLTSDGVPFNTHTARKRVRSCGSEP